MRTLGRYTLLQRIDVEQGDEARIARLLAKARPPPPTLKVLRLPRRTRDVVDAGKMAWPSLQVVERTVPDENRPTHVFVRKAAA